MTKFIAGAIFGIIVATVGFNGFAGILNSGVQQIQEFSIRNSDSK